MNDYMPTRDEVREWVNPGARELFDRWLAFEKGGPWRKSAQIERERIIALLETNMCNVYGEDCSENPECGAKRTIIALIKGENK